MDKSIDQARVLLLLSVSKAREAKALLAHLLLRHGLPFLRKISVILAQTVQQWHHKTLSWLSATVSCPQVDRAIRVVEGILKQALASIVVCMNSNALKVAAKQLISVSIRQHPGQDYVQKLNGLHEPTITCNLRLLGGLIW